MVAVMIDEETFGAWWGVACERWSPHPRSAVYSKIFYDALTAAGVTSADFEFAMRRLLMTSKYFPGPGDVVEAARAARRPIYRSLPKAGPFGPDEETRRRLREMFK